MGFMQWIKGHLASDSAEPSGGRKGRYGPMYCRLSEIEGLQAEYLEAERFFQRDNCIAKTAVVLPLEDSFVYCHCNFKFDDADEYCFKFVDRVRTLATNGVFDVLVGKRGLGRIVFLAADAREAFEREPALRKHGHLFHVAPRVPLAVPKGFERQDWASDLLTMVRVLGPDSMSEGKRIRLGEIAGLRTLEEVDAALAGIDQDLDANPNDADLLRLRLDILGPVGRRDEIERMLATHAERLRKDPNLAVEFPEPLFYMLATGDADGALRVVRGVSRTWSDTSHFAFLRAVVLTQAGAAAEAAPAFERLRKTKKDSHVLRTHLAQCYLALNRPAEALSVADEGLRLEPGDVTLRLLKIQALQRTGRTKEACRVLLSALDSDPDNEDLYWSKTAKLLTHDGEDAGRLQRRLADRVRALPEVAIETPSAVLMLLQLDGAEDALTVVRRVGERASLSPEFRVARGIVFAMNELWEAAVVDLESARSELPNQPPLCLTLGKALLGLHRPSRALSVLDEGLAMAPHDSSLLACKVNALCDLRRAEDAAVVLRDAMKRHPRSGVLAVQRLHVLVAEKRIADFMKEFGQVVAVGEDAINELLHDESLLEFFGAVIKGSGMDEVERWRELAQNQPHNLPVQRHTADLILNAEGGEAALRWLEPRLARHPGDFRLRMARLRVMAGSGAASDELAGDVADLLDSYVADRDRAAQLVSLLRSSAGERFEGMLEAYLGKTSMDPFRLAAAGVGLLEAGESDEARGYLERAVELAPDAYNLAHLAEACLASSDGSRAVELARKALALDPEEATAGIALAEALLEEGGHPAALAALDGLPTHLRERARPETVRAKVLMELCRWDESIDVWRRLMEVEGRTPAALDGLATVYRKAGRHEQALETAVELAESKPGSVAAVSEIVDASVALGRGEEGLELLRRFGVEQSDESNSHYHRGRLLSHLRRTSEAADAFQKAVELNDGKAWLWIEAAEAFEAAGLHGSARAALQRAAALRPTTDLATKMSELGFDEDALALLDSEPLASADRETLLSGRMNSLLGLARRREALAASTELVELDADWADYHYWRGWTLELVSRWTEARDEYRRACDGAPDDAGSHLRLGFVESLIGQRDDAARELGKVVELLAKADEKRDAWDLDDLAYAHMLLGEFEEALRALEESVSASPFSRALFHHALATLAVRDAPPALRKYDEAIEFLKKQPQGRWAGELDLALRDLAVMTPLLPRRGSEVASKEAREKLEAQMRRHPLPEPDTAFRLPARGVGTEIVKQRFLRSAR